MEENELTLKEYFSVVKKYWKFFVIVLLASIIVSSVVLVIIRHFQPVNNSISVRISDDTDLVKYVNEKKYHLIKNAYLSIGEEIDYQKINDLSSEFEIEQKEKEYILTLKHVDNVSEEELEKIIKALFTEINNNFKSYDEDTKTIINSKFNTSSDKFEYGKDVEIIENLLNFRSKTYSFEKKLSDVVTFLPELDGYSDYNKTSLKQIKAKLNNIVGSEKDSFSLEGITNVVILGKVTSKHETEASYKEYLEKLIVNDPKGISEIYDKLSNIDADKKPIEYEKYVNKLLSLKVEQETYDNNQEKCEKAINVLDDSIDSVNCSENQPVTSNITSLGNDFNALLDTFDSFLNGLLNDDTFLTSYSDIQKSKDIELKEIVLVDFIIAIVIFVIVYLYFFIRLKKQGFFEHEQENDSKTLNN